MKIIFPIYFSRNYIRYKKQNNIVGENQFSFTKHRVILLSFASMNWSKYSSFQRFTVALNLTCKMHYPSPNCDHIYFVASINVDECQGVQFPRIWGFKDTFQITCQTPSFPLSSYPYQSKTLWVIGHKVELLFHLRLHIHFEIHSIFRVTTTTTTTSIYVKTFLK